MKYHPISRPLPYESAPPVMHEDPPKTGYYELPLLGIVWLHQAVVGLALAMTGSWGAAAGVGVGMVVVAARGAWVLRRIAIEWDEEVQAMTAGSMEPETQDLKTQDAREDMEMRELMVGNGQVRGKVYFSSSSSTLESSSFGSSSLGSSSLGSCVSPLKGGAK